MIKIVNLKLNYHFFLAFFFIAFNSASSLASSSNCFLYIISFLNLCSYSPTLCIKSSSNFKFTLSAARSCISFTFSITFYNSSAHSGVGNGGSFFFFFFGGGAFLSFFFGSISSGSGYSRSG